MGGGDRPVNSHICRSMMGSLGNVRARMQLTSAAYVPKNLVLTIIL